MLDVAADIADLKKLQEVAIATGKNIDRELSAAINATAQPTRKVMARGIVEKVNLKVGVVNKKLKKGIRSNPKTLRTSVNLKHQQRLGLQHFGASQTKKGVAYKIDKSGGRKMVVGAFMGPKPRVKAPKLNGGAFIRAGRTRLPIRRLHGVSPWAVFLKRSLDSPTVKQSSQRLSIEVNKRIGKALRGF
jgi:hypothetical protein